MKAAVKTIATWTLPALVSALVSALVVVGLIAGGAYVTLAAFRPDPAIFAPWDRPVDNF